MKAQQDQRLIHILMKVNDHFANVRSNILMQQPLPPVSQAYRLLAQEEKHKKIISQAQPQPEQMALQHKGSTPERPIDHLIRPSITIRT